MSEFNIPRPELSKEHRQMISELNQRLFFFVVGEGEEGLKNQESQKLEKEGQRRYYARPEENDEFSLAAFAYDYTDEIELSITKKSPDPKNKGLEIPLRLIIGDSSLQLHDEFNGKEPLLINSEMQITEIDSHNPRLAQHIASFTSGSAIEEICSYVDSVFYELDLVG